MEVREANVKDMPAIIGLLKTSLGETLLPKSEKIWNWKHVDNPFGRSYVMVAEEDNTVIGLRAFMRWQWQWGEKRFRAIRAVDTATHPAFQGKGIFRTLTLAQIDLCKKDGVDFVFNTPNNQSKPGYLKMGWLEQGKMPVKIKIRNVISFGYKKLFHHKGQVQEAQDPTPVIDWTNIIPLISKYSYNYKPEGIFTAPSEEYVRWRYASCPLHNYTCFTDHDNYMLIARIKENGYYKELRLVDFFPLRNITNNKPVRQLRKELIKYSREHNVDVLTISGNEWTANKKHLRFMGCIPALQVGPAITLRDLNVDSLFLSLLSKDNWNYSLGAMELF